MIQYGNSFFASVGVFTYPLHTSILGKNLDEGTPMFFVVENQQSVLTDAPTSRYAGILRLRQATGEWAVSRKEYVADENGKIALTFAIAPGPHFKAVLVADDGTRTPVDSADVTISTSRTVLSLGAGNKGKKYEITARYTPDTKSLWSLNGEHEAFGNIAENGYGALIQYGNHTVATTVYDAGANWELTEGSAPPDLYVANGMFTTDGGLPGAVKLENTFIEAVPTMGADSALILNVK